MRPRGFERADARAFPASPCRDQRHCFQDLTSVSPQIPVCHTPSQVVPDSHGRKFERTIEEVSSEKQSEGF